MESSNDAVISKDLKGLITSWNPAATRLFGYAPDEIIGQSVFKIVPQELHQQEREVLKRLKAGIRLDHYESDRIDKNGQRIRVSLTISPLKDDAGQVIGASTIIRDFPERLKIDEARFRLAAIVESSDDAIIGKDLNGIITSWNAAAARLLEYSPEEIVGQSVLKLIPPHLHHQEALVLAKLRSGERIAHFETQRITKTGRVVEVSLTMSPVKDDQGHVIGASKIMRDISQKKAMERTLVEAEKIAATGRMAATVAHEINNPLESVVNLIYLARNNESANDKVKKYLQLAEREIERVSHLARQTLGFYRDTTSATEICLHDIVEEVLSVYQSKLRSSRIAVERRFQEVGLIWLRKGEATQIISNLIANAIDAMPSGGVLQVGVFEWSNSNENGVMLSVGDNGVGIEQEALGKLFDPFFTTKKSLGNGLGLWVVRQFIDHLGGTIDVNSRTDPATKGTTFSIFMPYENVFAKKAATDRAAESGTPRAC